MIHTYSQAYDSLDLVFDLYKREGTGSYLCCPHMI